MSAEENETVFASNRRKFGSGSEVIRDSELAEAISRSWKSA
jgi:hypothetical protein